MSNILCSICLNDIPRDKIKVSESNGKKYVSFVVSQMKQPDQFEQTHTIFVSQPKEEREAKAEKQYIGKGKAIDFTPVAATAEAVEAMQPISETDDLPF